MSVEEASTPRGSGGHAITPPSVAGGGRAAAAMQRVPADLLAFLLGYLILLPLYLAPLVVTRLLPGQELPFVLSFVDTMGQLAQGGGAYAALYEGELRLAPYALHPFLLLLLQGLLALTTTHKLLMALYISALPLAMARLLSTFGKDRVPALCAFPLCYNLNLFHGHASFLLSLPLLLLFLAQVADNTDDQHEDEEQAVQRALLRDLLLCALGVLLFVSHLGSFLFGVAAALALIFLGDAPMVYRIRAALCLLPGLTCLGWWQASAVGNQALDRPLWTIANMIARERGQEIGSLPMAAALQDLSGRLREFPEHLLAGFRDHVDQVGAMAGAAALAVYIALGILGIFARGGDRSQGRLQRAALGLILLSGACYLGLPQHAHKLGLATLYPRVAVLLAFFFLLLCPAWLKRYPRWAQFLLCAPGLLSAGWYGIELTRHFDRYGQEVADFLHVLEKTPGGGRALGVVLEPESKVLQVEAALVALPAYYPVEQPGDRGGRSMMPQPLCDRDHVPCRTRDAQLAPPAPSPYEPRKLQPDKAVPYFNYFFVRGAHRREGLFGAQAQSLEVQASQGSWTVYRRRGLPELQRPESGLNPPAPDRREAAPQEVKPPRRHRRSR